MHLHEFQAKELFKKAGIVVPAGVVFGSLEELEEKWPFWAESGGWLKAQVHAGGRGKAGGVLFGADRKELFHKAKQLFQHRIVNRQTGPSGLPIQKILLSEPIAILREQYLALTFSPAKKNYQLLAAQGGGMDIEMRPEKEVLTFPLPPEKQLRSYHRLLLQKHMGWDPSFQKIAFPLVDSLVSLFFQMDCQLIEINPLVEDTTGRLIALDAKMSLDENALFRHQELKSWRDLGQFTPQEAQAHQIGLSYVSLEGNIGCLVNGAGLAMATLDLLQRSGGRAANFLDIGGSATEETMQKGLQLLFSDPRVKVVLVNIFGGIVSCKAIGEALLHALRTLSSPFPIVIRFAGTEAKEGLALFQSTSQPIHLAENFDEAVSRSVALAKETRWPSS